MSDVARFGLWIYTGTIVLAVLYIVLFNPGDTFGDVQTTTSGWLQTYPGQSAALQLLGTFIAAIGAMGSLVERRLTDKVPIFISIPGMAGAWVVMAGLAIQDVTESSVAPAVLGVLLFYIAPAWILSMAWAWLKSCCKPGG